jgi:hypothetical protein
MEITKSELEKVDIPKAECHATIEASRARDAQQFELHFLGSPSFLSRRTYLPGKDQAQ